MLGGVLSSFSVEFLKVKSGGFMKTGKKGKHLRIIALVMIIGLSFFACDTGHTHTWAWRETIPATCQTVGTEIETCAACDETRGDSRETAKLPHAWEWVASAVWGMETGECAGCAETEGLRFAPEMMVNISGGTFTLGNDSSSYSTEKPESRVTLSDFRMSAYEVTQEQYLAVMGTNPSHFTSNPATGEEQARRPVDSVSWYDAIVFCNRLSIMEGLSPVYSINSSTDPDDWGIVPTTSSDAIWDAVVIVSDSTGYRLPTEAQWEYAAKGGNPDAPGWVEYIYSGSDIFGDVA